MPAVRPQGLEWDWYEASFILQYLSAKGAVGKGCCITFKNAARDAIATIPHKFFHPTHGASGHSEYQAAELGPLV